MPKTFQTCPYLPQPIKFGTEAQAPLPPKLTPELDAKGIKRVQKIVGSILCYVRVVNMTVLIALSSIAVEQTKATEKQWRDAPNYWITCWDTRMQWSASMLLT